MDDWFAGIYLKPITTNAAPDRSYERSAPHRHDFYYCVLLEKGCMELEVDFEQVKLGDHSLFFSYPGQVHQINRAQLERGWFLAFDPAIVDEALRNILDQFLTEIVSLKLSPEQSIQLYTALAQLNTVYRNEGVLFRQQTLLALLTAFIYSLASAYLSVEGFSLSKHTERNIEITKRFKQLLRLRYLSMRRPAQFATEMNMTVSHLNDTVREVTGFPVTYHIQQEVMKEARRLLYYSNLSVKEISASLGFDDPKYFNRLFSKITGQSPGSFRKSLKKHLEIKGQV